MQVISAILAFLSSALKNEKEIAKMRFSQFLWTYLAKFVKLNERI